MASPKVPSDQEEKALRLAIARQEDTLCALARDRDVAERELRRLKSQFDSLEKEQSEDAILTGPIQSSFSSTHSS